jgi:hypothetical protein
MSATGAGTGAPLTPAVLPNDNTLAALRAAIRLQLSQTVDWPNATLHSYIGDAIRFYANEFPREAGYTIPAEDDEEVPVATNHWEALVAFVDFRAHWQLSATEAAEMSTNSIALSQLSATARMAWNRYKEVMDRITWQFRGQSATITWDDTRIY